MQFFKTWLVSVLPLTALFYGAGLFLRHGGYGGTALGLALCLVGAVCIGFVVHRDMVKERVSY